MEFISTLDFAFVKDCVLIGLCAICALYCLLLSKRLRALSNIKTGLGASIVSLTEAIETTHQASQASRRDITVSIMEMQDLISQADSKANVLEARLTEIKRNVKTAAEIATALNNVINLKAPLALNQIKAVSENMSKLTENQLPEALEIPEISETSEVSETSIEAERKVA